MEETNFINNLSEQTFISEIIGCEGDVFVVDSNIINEENEDDKNLKEFLSHIGMELIFDYLKDAQVTYRSLPFLKKEDLKEAIPPLGLRAEFREKLFSWKKTKCGDTTHNDDTISVPSKVEEWFSRDETPTLTPASSCSKIGGILSKDLKILLSNTTQGNAVLKFAEDNNKLACEHRDYIINVILEDVIGNNIVLCTQDYNRLLDEIISLFPFESKMKVNIKKVFSCDEFK